MVTGKSLKTSKGESIYFSIVTEKNNKIIVVLAQLRGGISEIYTQDKINQMEEKEDSQNWNEFIREIKIIFSDKSKITDTECKIEPFR